MNEPTSEPNTAHIAMPGLEHLVFGTRPGCGTCFWWTAIDRNEINGCGWCHRYPPVGNQPPFSEDHSPEGSEQPITDIDDWCGEWRDMFTFQPLANVLVTPTPPASTTHSQNQSPHDKA